MDIIGNSEIKSITAVSQLQDPGYDYLSGGSGSGSHMFYIKRNDMTLEIGLTDAGKKSTKYFDDKVKVLVKNVNGQEDYAMIRIIKPGEDRSRFYANVMYPMKSGYNPGEQGEIVIRARTEYLYANSSEEEVGAFDNLDKNKLGKYVVDLSGISVQVNNTRKDDAGNAIKAIEATVESCEPITEDDIPYYEIKIKVNALEPGTAKVVTTVTGKYMDSNGEFVEDHLQTRDVVASFSVFNPIATSGGSSGGGGSGGSYGGSGSGGGSSSVGSSSGSSSGGNPVGVAFAGMGAVALLALFILGKKMSGH